MRPFSCESPDHVTAGGLIAFFLWVRVPEVKFSGVASAENITETFQVRGNTELIFNLRVNITIDNPNYITINFDEIKATAFHPAMPDVVLGNGSIKDVTIMKKAMNVLLFPLSIHYNITNDPQKLILQDLISRCGSSISGQKKGSIDMDYEIDLNFRMLAFTGFVPKIRSKAGFDCPQSQPGPVISSSAKPKPRI
ncbi:hypothetical protein K493DRAFT_346518 [Basidiobolus meristosporus CBS 931.73]|uniref:Late embryogenesis abundant protein LEA-2 subgroup domain-containing protein n=1 Tax=Basidiobolus meristosporus CBS 931.73 TaxID=1314790 RepID=A0A1Y1YXY3_9FUNG|nr:hypothetical protein K493DRAFT_346518 [Basidiobolus meristosporus CBS 931.73]|eukprot:ORY02796.1 hypothetical protein K493DRAFT_346518 [Basidiobolus meristosporus CBS 931.73]